MPGAVKSGYGARTSRASRIGGLPFTGSPGPLRARPTASRVARPPTAGIDVLAGSKAITAVWPALPSATSPLSRAGQRRNTDAKRGRARFSVSGDADDQDRDDRGQEDAVERAGAPQAGGMAHRTPGSGEGGDELVGTRPFVTPHDSLHSGGENDWQAYRPRHTTVWTVEPGLIRSGARTRRRQPQPPRCCPAVRDGCRDGVPDLVWPGHEDPALL
jgi:hypothetical protein